MLRLAKGLSVIVRACADPPFTRSLPLQVTCLGASYCNTIKEPSRAPYCVYEGVSWLLVSGWIVFSAAENTRTLHWQGDYRNGNGCSFMGLLRYLHANLPGCYEVRTKRAEAHRSKSLR